MQAEDASCAKDKCQMTNVRGMLLGLGFITLAAANVVLMLEAGRTRDLRIKNRLIILHRVGGYLFVMFFCAMAVLMCRRLFGVGMSGKLPVRLVLHVALALVLAPLLFFKVLIAKRYRQAHSLLMPLGIVIFVTSFVLVFLPVLSDLLRSIEPGSWSFKAEVVLVVLAISLSGLALWSAMTGYSRSSVSLGVSDKGIDSSNPAQRMGNEPMTLLLAKIIQETHDTKTLRFLLPRERPLRARPGQFLTFRWVIDGKQVLRSYTVSSSPLQAGFVEITPKRIENGCVSNFLHNEVKPGLTVEASGPNGEFYFDETIHQSIVLIAAGSGITPMVSILRYLEDRRLSTSATLLYCVRTRQDIIFDDEFKRLKRALPGFKYSVCLSHPDERWNGYSGRLTRDLIVDQAAQLDLATFFLCGPKGFMDSARQILKSLSVDEGRITQESFGEGTAAPTLDHAMSQNIGTVEFVLSQKTCALLAHRTLLEAAETNGVRIPFSCRQGECGTCATRVLSGAVRMEREDGLNTEQKRAGYVLPCVSRGEGTIVVDA